MPTFNDALRGYAFPIHKRDNFVCQYCGLNGLSSFSNWLSLTLDHLVPKEHPNRNKKEYQTTACQFCNTADNNYFKKAKEENLRFDGMTRDELIGQRRPYVEKVRQKYLKFWLENVQNYKQP